MKVWIVTYDVAFVGWVITEVFSSREKAQAFADTLDKDRYSIEAWEVK